MLGFAFGGAQVADQFRAVHFRQTYVRHEYVGPPVASERKCLRGVGRLPQVSARRDQYGGKQRQCVGFVVHGQHAEAVKGEGNRETGKREEAGMISSPLSGGAKRQGDGEGCAMAYAWAGGGDRAAVEFDQMFDDAQSQAEAARAARAPSCCLKQSTT